MLKVHCMAVIEETLADVILLQVYTVVSVIARIKTLVLSYKFEVVHVFYISK